MSDYHASTIFMLAPQRHGSNKTQSLLAAKNPALFGPYPPVPRRSFMALEPMAYEHLLDAMVLSANLSPRPLVPGGRLLTTAEVDEKRRERGLPGDALGISLAINAVGARLAGKAHARILCKAPDNLDITLACVDRLKDAAFVHLVRDPRAVWNSARGTPRGPQAPHASALRWADYHARVLELGRTTPIITLKYEELMVRTEAELRRACEFLDVPFTADMLEGHDSNELRLAASSHPGLWGNLAKPIQHDRITAWQRELPAEEIDIIDNSCREVMEAFGYEPRGEARELSEEEKALRPDLPPPDEGAEPRRHQLIHIEHLRRSHQIAGAPHGTAS